MSWFAVVQQYMSRKWNVKLDDWLRTGEVAELCPGKSHLDVLRLLGRPSATGPKVGTPIPGYWLYGIVEFGLSLHGHIDWIQADTVNIGSDLHESDVISIDWQGIFHNMPIDECIDWLVRHDLRFHHEADGDGGRLNVDGMAQLLFVDEEAPVLVTVWTPPMK